MMAASVLHTVPVERLRDAEAKLAVARDRIAELEEEVRQLRAFRFGDEDAAPLPAGVRLTALEDRIWTTLWARRGRVWTREALVNAAYWGHDAPPTRSVDVILHRTRRKLAPHGVVIETVWGVGWRLAEWPREWEGGDVR